MSIPFGAEAPTRLCHRKPEGSKAPPGGWLPFFNSLTLSVRWASGGPTSCYLPAFFDDGSNLEAKIAAWMAKKTVFFSNDKVSYKTTRALSSGTYGQVWEMEVNTPTQGYPSLLALKIFKQPDSAEVAKEVGIVDMMNTIDSRLGWGMDRVPACAFVDDDNAPCVLMARASAGAVPSTVADEAEALEVVKAACLEMMSMHSAYGLVCFDAKPANFLLDCPPGRGGRPRAVIRAADYGGYALPGRVSWCTFPPPWLRKTSQDGVGCRVSEETGVYGLLTFFMILSGADTQILQFNGVLPRTTMQAGDADKVRHLVEYRRRMQTHPPAVRDFINYCLQNVGTSSGGVVTLEGAGRVLGVTEVIVVD